VFSTVGAFYLPLTFIVVIYLNVYRVARARIRRRQFNRRRDDGRQGTSVIDPDPDTTTQSPGVVWYTPGVVWHTPGVVWQALRARLNAISLGLPAAGPMHSLPASRTSSIDDCKLRRSGSTSNSAADRNVSSSTQPPPPPHHQQQLLQPPAPAPSRQFLSVDTPTRLSESSSAPSSASSSRGGSWIYFTR